jgi:hypothetical protein
LKSKIQTLLVIELDPRTEFLVESYGPSTVCTLQEKMGWEKAEDEGGGGGRRRKEEKGKGFPLM